MEATANLETLPDELLIAILTHDLETRPRHYQKILTRMCLVSKRLHRIAHEMLLTRPYARVEFLDLLYAQYLKCLDVASKVKTIEITCRRKKSCLCDYRYTYLDNEVLQESRQLESLFTILPHLDTLLLGANQFSRVISLQTNFLKPGVFICMQHEILRVHHYEPLGSLQPPTAIAEALGRLKVLELPVGWDVIFGFTSTPILDLTACTSLEHLTVPTTALIQRCPDHAAPLFGHDVIPSKYTLCPLPQSLLRLTLSRGGGIPRPFCDIGDVLSILALRLRPSLPRLTNLEIWSQLCDPSAEIPGDPFPQQTEERNGKVLSGCASIEAMGIRVIIHYETKVNGSELIADSELDQDLRYIEYDGLVCRGYFREWGIWGRSWQKIRRTQYRFT